MKFTIINKYNLFLSGFIILLFFLSAYNLTFNFKSTVIHQWRQADCLSIAKNYYEEGMNFFQPKIHWQEPIQGKAVSEMPLINYSVAGLWKIFGESEGIYRLFNYLIYVISIFALFNTFFKENINPLLSFFFVSLFLTSPLLSYYSYNFLSDVPALSLSIMGFCFFINYCRNKRVRYFFTALIFATVAVLLKASAVVPLALIIIVYFIDLFRLNNLFKTEEIFKTKAITGTSILLASTGCLLWYNYATNYNNESNSSVFLIGILPIWDLPEQEILLKIAGLFSDQMSVFMNRPMLFLFFIGVLYVIFNFKVLESIFKLAFTVSFVFFLMYILLFFKVFDVHDYYLINLMIFPVITFFCIGQILLKRGFTFKGNKWLVTSLIIIIFFNSFYSAAFYRLRTIKDDKVCDWYPFLTPSEKDFNDFSIEKYQRTMGLLENIRPELKRLGIKRNDLVLSVPDISPNSSLYLMDQKGHTISYPDFVKDTLWKSGANFRNCSYLVLNDSTLKNSLTFKTISGNLERIFKKSHVEIYKIKY